MIKEKLERHKLELLELCQYKLILDLKNCKNQQAYQSRDSSDSDSSDSVSRLVVTDPVVTVATVTVATVAIATVPTAT